MKHTRSCRLPRFRLRTILIAVVVIGLVLSRCELKPDDGSGVILKFHGVLEREPGRIWRVARKGMPYNVVLIIHEAVVDVFATGMANHPSILVCWLFEFSEAQAFGATELKPARIWVEQCEAAENIEGEFGTQKALDYLVGEKLLNFLEVAETDADFRAEIPEFVAKIKMTFERWQLAHYLGTAHQAEPFDSRLFEPRSHSLLGEDEVEFDAEEVEEMRKDDIRQCTRDLLLVERAREWLLKEEA